MLIDELLEHYPVRQLSKARYIYAVYEELGMEPPHFILAVDGGFSLELAYMKRDDAEEMLKEIQKVCDTLGISCINPQVSEEAGNFFAECVIPKYEKS